MTTTHDTASQPTAELPPFVLVPDAAAAAGAARTDAPGHGLVGTPPPTVEEAGRPRRWSTGHTVAAAVVAVGVLASGGVAVAARGGGTGSVPGAPGGVAPGFGRPNQQVPGRQLPGGQLPGGQLPGGQLPGGQLPGGQLGGPFGDDHDDDGGRSGSQPPGSTTDGTDGTTGTTTGSVTT
ncbi:MAG: hypothetical protein ABI807_16260 [Sporichthyaceae bacterium]